ncbi:Uncharacterized protein TCM_002872 [Theobroma cacao]|uniref:Uncharacterized protein n=1 Tax=Theobroma cacao TaxID=3641 RepID=A0A061DP55_THECC|nr:Uncharacterized protein TCM_002872 [Theobroma cacao]
MKFDREDLSLYAFICAFSRQPSQKIWAQQCSNSQVVKKDPKVPGKILSKLELLGHLALPWPISCHDFLKSVLPDGVKEVKPLRRSQSALLKQLQNNLIPNIKLLREIGVPQSSISVLTNVNHAVFAKPRQT